MEFLKETLGEELYNQVAEKLKDTDIKLVNLTDGGYVAKDKLTKAEERAKTAETALTEERKSLETLKASAGDSEELKAQIQKLQDEAKTKADEYEKQLQAERFERVFEQKLSALNPKDIELTKAAFDRTKMSLDGENLIGFDEIAKTVTAEKDWLFKETVNTGDPANPADAKDKTSTADEKMISAIWGGMVPTNIKEK